MQKGPGVSFDLLQLNLVESVDLHKRC